MKHMSFLFFPPTLVFHSFTKMQHALLVTKEVEAILEEVHPAMYHLKKSNQLTPVRHFQSERRYGFVVNTSRHYYLPGCVRSLIKNREKDIFTLINTYLNQVKVGTGQLDHWKI